MKFEQFKLKLRLMQSPLDQARELILSISTPTDAKDKIDQLEKLSPEELNKHLTELYNTAEQKAYAGDTKGISIILRVLEHFDDRSHDRMLLHYIAQAEANQELKQDPHNESITKALKIISEAFADADNIDNQIGAK